MSYTLSLSDIDFLKQEISKSGLTYSHLRDDLIDHVCCDVEYEMAKGIPFDKAYEQVKQKIGMGGLERIQHETLYLIDKKYRTMKKTMKIFGIVAPITLAFGVLFKTEHWPGANILLLLGFFFLSFIFLPSAVYVNFKEVSNKTKKWSHILGFLGTFLISLSFVLKIMHWPGAAVIMFFGIIITCLLFLPMFLHNKLNDKTEAIPRYILLFAFVGLIVFLIAFFFKVMHWPGAAILMILGLISMVFVAFPAFTIHKFKSEKYVTNNFIFTVVALIWLIIPISLLAINLSADVMKPATKTSEYLNANLSQVAGMNQVLFSQLKNEPHAVSINKQAGELTDFIQAIKVQMVQAMGANDALGADNQIVLSGIYNTNVAGLYSKVLQNGHQAEKLGSLLLNYKNELLSVSANKEYKSYVESLTQFDIDLDAAQSEVFLLSLNKLSFLQLNVELAHEAAFMQIKQQLPKLTALSK